MNKEAARTNRLSRRGFLQIVAFAGATGACWKLGLLGFQKRIQMARRSQPIMGTVLNLTVYGPDPDICEEALNQTITTMQDLERKFSRHMASSELSTLNKNGYLKNPGEDLLNILHLSQELSKKTDGAFDVTILPLLHLHEEIRGANSLPNQLQYQTAHKLVGYEKLAFSNKKIQLTSPDMGVSLDGIGKGYIVDQGVTRLKSLGFNNVFVEAGGDLMVSGHKEDQVPWRIGIRNPRPQQKKRPVTIEISDKAVATSGDYLQPFTDDLQHHHIIDPRSGFSPPELASCTVTAPTVALADGLATATMVLGKDDALDLIESIGGCEAYLVDKKLNAYNTTGFFS
jgi:thiamine biosynthesis lipoprotein